MPRPKVILDVRRVGRTDEHGMIRVPILLAEVTRRRQLWPFLGTPFTIFVISGPTNCLKADFDEGLRTRIFLSAGSAPSVSSASKSWFRPMPRPGRLAGVKFSGWAAISANEAATVAEGCLASAAARLDAIRKSSQHRMRW